LRIEELHDALAFADDLRGHSASAAATKAATTAAAAAESTAAAAAVAAGALTKASATATVAISTAAAEAAAFLETASVAESCFFEKSVALVFTATSTVAFAPSIETHSVQTSVCPNKVKTNALGLEAHPVSCDSYSRTVQRLT
jgi:hypothetical protein